VNGTPEEAVGYIASEEYTSRLASPPPSHPAVESPLRKTSFAPSELERTRSAQSAASSETGVIHVDDPYHPLHHPDGYAQTPDYVSHDPMEDEEYDDEPILAADEVRPDSAFLHPAISPSLDRRGSSDYHDLERTRSRTPSAPNSRAGSRPSSLHGAPAGLSRWNSRGEDHEDNHTPLEDVEEYEPLFPEDDQAAKPVPTADRFKKRTELLKHRFPSQDIWEDTPDSLQLHASVSTPELPKEQSGRKFEKPQAEEARKKQTEQMDSHGVASRIVGSHGDTRGGGPPSRPDTIKQRFPSRDIWEDAPESQNLVTTIEPSDAEARSPPDASSKPIIPPRPSIPIRPQRAAKATSPEEKSSSPTEARKAPAIPGRPKPQIPSRPSKPITHDSPDNATAPKAKPAVPVRPTGGKIASLKAGFLSDLNSRLQLGPQVPKPAEKREEQEAPAEEKGPLSDARKGRARGPPRRKPAVTPEKKLPSIPEIRIMDAWNVWQVEPDGHLVISRPEKTVRVEEKPLPAPDAAEEPTEETTMAPPNVAGESADPVPSSEKEATISEAPHVHESTEGPTAPADETTTKTFPQAASLSANAEDPIQAELEPAIQPKAEREEAEAGMTAASTKDIDYTSSSSESILSDSALEHMAASADGKKESDGDIHTGI
jgi:hypothetical protein